MKRFSLVGLALALGLLLVVTPAAYDFRPRIHHSNNNSNNHNSTTNHWQPSTIDPAILRQMQAEAAARQAAEEKARREYQQLQQRAQVGLELLGTLNLPTDQLTARVQDIAKKYKDGLDPRLIEPVLQLDRRQRALEDLDAALRGPDAATWRKLEVRALPEPLAGQASNWQGLLLGLTDLQTEYTGWARQNPDARQVVRCLTAIREVKSYQGTADRLAQDVALRAFLRGHPSLALEILPEDGPPAHAAELLRDLKTLVAGQGEVITEPGRAVGRELNDGPGAPRGPPTGVALMVPEADVRGYRLRVRERADADLPPLIEASLLKAAEQVREFRPALAAARITLTDEATKVREQVREEFDRGLDQLLDDWMGRRKLSQHSFPGCLRGLIKARLLTLPPDQSAGDVVELMLATAAVELDNRPPYLLNNFDGIKGLARQYYPNLSTFEEQFRIGLVLQKAANLQQQVRNRPGLLTSVEEKLGHPLGPCGKILVISLAEEPDLEKLAALVARTHRPCPEKPAAGPGK